MYDTPTGHVTRDYQEAPAQLADLRFLAIDTSGLEPFLPSGTIQARATALTAGVLHRADVALFLVDGRDGVLPPDQSLAKWLREAASIGDKVVLAANKCERRRKGGEAGVGWALAEAAALGFGQPVAISAETGEGMIDLFHALQPRLDPIIASRRALVDEISNNADDSQASPSSGSGRKRNSKAIGIKSKERPQSNVTKNLKIAVMGLVNVGKSTLTNRLLGTERCLTGPEPGLTRDAITVHVTHNEQQIELVDTAGWVRRARLSAHDDSGGVVSTRTLQEGRTVLRFVHIVVLVVDAARAAALGEGLTHAEATLAADVAREGRALIVLANKMDALPSEASRASALEMIQKAVEQCAPGVRGGAIIPVSALTGTGVDLVVPTAVETYAVWNSRVPTSKLNAWFKGVVSSLSPGGGSEIKRVKYLSQVKARPPTFVAFVGGGGGVGRVGLMILRRGF